jgi:menaquinol-cytochrome c reductase iron-sulfur subunit
MSGTKISRREFVGWVTAGVGAIMCAVVGLPGIAYIVGPSLSKQEIGDWQPLGPLSQVEASTEPVLFTLSRLIEAGWRKTIKKEIIYVQQLPNGELLAQSNVCTHLACIVHWEADRQRFFCPCHDGVYDRLGNVVSGPPPRPLDRYQVKVENGQVWVGKLYHVS